MLKNIYPYSQDYLCYNKAQSLKDEQWNKK